MSKLNPEIRRIWLVDVGSAEPAICSTEFFVLLSKPPFGRFFVDRLVRSQEFRLKLEGLVTGTSKSHQRVHPASVLKIPVTIPSENVLSLFEKVVAPLLNAIQARNRECYTLAAVRDALLPRLISGELRVPQADRALAELV